MTHAYSLKPDAVENSTTQSRLREHFIQWAPLAKIAGTAAKKDERRRPPTSASQEPEKHLTLPTLAPVCDAITCGTA